MTRLLGVKGRGGKGVRGAGCVLVVGTWSCASLSVSQILRIVISVASSVGMVACVVVVLVARDDILRPALV